MSEVIVKNLDEASAPKASDVTWSSMTAPACPLAPPSGHLQALGVRCGRCRRRRRLLRTHRSTWTHSAWTHSAGSHHSARSHHSAGSHHGAGTGTPAAITSVPAIVVT